MTVSLSIGADHRGMDLKWSIIGSVYPNLVHDLRNIKPEIPEGEDVDYPDIVKEFAETFDFYTHGILICGSGHGMCISANRYKGVRAAVCRTVKEVKQSRLHNDLNVLCIGADYTNSTQAMKLVNAFLVTDFSGEPRHIKRNMSLEREEPALRSLMAEKLINN
jgi:ribose 5-phosphate isomerase B